MKTRRYVTKAATNRADEEDEQVQHVYVRSDEHVWVPALQVKSLNNGSTAKVIRPVFRNEKEILQCGRRDKQKYNDYELIDLTSSTTTTTNKKQKKNNNKSDNEQVDYPNQVLPMQNVDSSGVLQDYKDMVQLPYMHEAAILYNLKLRHSREKPYTRTGDIVIAVNPYNWIHDMYTEKKRSYYSKRLVWDTYNNNSSETSSSAVSDPRDQMEAHVYEVSALAYKGLLYYDQDQSILVSGESGAGKTETVKICLNHIATTQRGDVPVGYYKSGENSLDPVVERILESNPLLEAFGNAKTQRNDNSSRFGKYMQLQFSKTASSSNGRYKLKYGSSAAPRCNLVGSVCEVYLLEKNRVVSHNNAAGERNFHIFYQLLAAPDKLKNRIWPQLVGKKAHDFAYVGETATRSIEGVSDADRFVETIKALELVNVTNDTLLELLQAICVVMQLGNIKFSGDTDSSKITTKDDLVILTDLMGLKNKKDLAKALTERTFVTKHETHMVPLSATAAADARDALAKEIYQKTFLWLVAAINKATRATVHGDDGKYGIIGMLDIFGFEVFKTNHFEQLCINYANEKLQQKFNEDIFRNVQTEYEVEGIPLDEIIFEDNDNVLSLIEGRTGLLALLNEECHRPKGNDISFVAKITQAHVNNSVFVEHKTDNLSFGIQHYAGSVMYDAENFVLRNQDTLPTDLQNCCEKSSNNIIRQPRSETATQKKIHTTNIHSDVRSQSNSNIIAPTIWEKYKNQLSSLMDSLRQTQSRYIRCIKPNTKKAPLLLEHGPVVDQLRCAGVVAGITIARSVFPNRLDNAVVLSRFTGLYDAMKNNSDNLNSSLTSFSRGPQSEEGRAKMCRKILRKVLKNRECLDKSGENLVQAYCVGHTKTYFRAGALEWLESQRAKFGGSSTMDEAATTIQAAVRGWLARYDSNGELERLRYEQREQERLDALQRDNVRKLKSESKDRINSMYKQEQEWMQKIKQLEESIEQDTRDTKRAVQAAEDRAHVTRIEINELESSIEEKEKQSNRDMCIIVAKQRKRLEEQKKVINYLRQENTKIRKIQQSVEDKYDNFKENSQKLYNGNSSMRSLFDELDDDTHKYQIRNEGLLKTHAATKAINEDLRAKVDKAQETYMEQAEVRLEYQKTMSRILIMIQTEGKNSQLIEDCVVTALDCEAESKAIMAGIDTDISTNSEPDLTGSDLSDSDNSLQCW